jgi:hypothetical protein
MQLHKKWVIGASSVLLGTLLIFGSVQKGADGNYYLRWSSLLQRLEDNKHESACIQAKASLTQFLELWRKGEMNQAKQFISWADFNVFITDKVNQVRFKALLKAKYALDSQAKQFPKPTTCTVIVAFQYSQELEQDGYLIFQLTKQKKGWVITGIE